MLVRQAAHLTPADGAFYLAPEHEEGWSRLLYVIEQQRRLVLVTGAAEVGKSCLLSAASAEISRTADMRQLSIDASGLTSGEFARRLADCCDGADEETAAWRTLEDWLWGTAAAGVPSLWLVDHIDQALDDLTLTLRRFVRLIEQTRAAATLIVAARDWNTVAPLGELADLWCELPPWSQTATRVYLQGYRPARERTATFSAHATQAVYDCTQGIAGRVRKLSELCHLAATLRETPVIEVDLVLEVYGELVSPLAHQHRVGV